MSILIWLFAVFTVAPQPRCSLYVEFHGPAADRMIVLAVATPESLRVALPDRALLSRRVPDTVRTTIAYRFRVVRATGGATDLAHPDTFLAVPWKYDSECALMPWGSEDWVPPGEETVFALTKRRGTIEGEPLYDLLGEHSPYPHAEFLKYESSPAPAANRQEWLSAGEYFALLSDLPETRNQTPAERLLRVERVFAEGNPRWRTTFPGTEILRRARAAGRK